MNKRTFTTRLAAAAISISLIATGCGSDTDPEAAEESVDETVAPEVTTAAPSTTSTTTTSTAAPTTTQAPTTTVAAEPEPAFELEGEIDLTTAEINDMISFVEETMEREFVTTPRIVVQSIADFEAGLVPTDEEMALNESRKEQTARFYQALGHTTTGVDDLHEALVGVSSSTDLISGRYDPFDDAVYVPDGALVGDTFNAVLVHELAHALDGQHIDLAGLINQLKDINEREALSDDGFAIRAIVEGRATAVQGRWMMTNNIMPEPADVPESLEALPPSIINSVLLPYQLGAQAIETLGGPAATWDLYDNIPTSSEQMLFTDRIGTDLPVEIAQPPADGEVQVSGTIGAEGILLVAIGDTLTPSQIDIVTAIGAIEGWAGDSMVLWGDDVTSCMRLDVAADTPEDLTEIETLFTGWAAKESVPGAERTAELVGDIVRVTACAPFIK